MTIRFSVLMISALTAAITLVPGVQAQGPANEAAEAVARAYMGHYSAIDLEAMAALLAEDAEFTDPTAEDDEHGETGFVGTGRESLITLLTEFVETYHPIEFGFEWDEVFTSNSRVVFIGHVNALYPTETEGQNFRWRSQQVTVITVRDGLVVRHQDFANYASPDRSLVAARTDN
jgi:ketosteroid isomerase-like protein